MRIAPILIALALAACGGDSSPAQVTIPATAPSPGVPPPTGAASAAPAPASWSARAAALYEVQPSIAGCAAGSLKAGARAEMLRRINAMRALHYLPPVVYSPADDREAEQAALMMAANRALSHAPPARWLCYTAAGAGAAGSSNLVLGYGTGLAWSDEEDYLGLWLSEGGGADIGHRRWLLDPFLGKIAYGRVTQQLGGGMRAEAAALKVFGFATAPAVPAVMPVFVAYPYGDYPERYFRPGDHLSFAVVRDAGARTANAAVSFANARIAVSGGGANLAVTDMASDNGPYGLPNSLQWRVAGLQPNISYTVSITGVSGAAESSYRYSFRILP